MKLPQRWISKQVKIALKKGKQSKTENLTHKYVYSQIKHCKTKKHNNDQEWCIPQHLILRRADTNIHITIIHHMSSQGTEGLSSRKWINLL